ncbi:MULTISPECIES: diaminopropionate ammonia-lyase [unclassified Sporosarcina]|uniref:diaminopropionate ammonia-lyase n=1 Tax=unclassified Sporosarcina TaxID=2647733 RepID=UPI00203AD28E|nr:MULTISPECIES: diaminopropionate ammonia-lyase [unclassified Sporosarcina]GKV66913.1 PLP-dependent lyase/thiolase [Sporosarcina sp. NCCP-2331]GLB57208.1 PLP-dependent lyase/thiolase [Sporosarcina sp. NCCP-2378]
MTKNEKQLKWVKNNFQHKNFKDNDLKNFDKENVREILNFQKTHPSYTHTPLYSLAHLADHLQISILMAKDESQRFGLNAFKVLGGIYAMAKYIANQLGEEIEDLSFEKLKDPSVKERLGDVTFISATDGNHGRGVAWAARELGFKSVIYMPKGSSAQRLEAIRNEGALAEIQDVNYDDTVRICARLAEKNGWVMVQDTAWEGYEEIPLWIMQGYSSIAYEIVEQWNETTDLPPTHLFLQAGVGSFAAGIAGYFLKNYGEQAPKIVIVEPDQADCFYQSFITDNGERTFVSGLMATEMAGLACGEPNTEAFKLLRGSAAGVLSCDDSIATTGMRVYGNPLKSDPRVISGESGSVTLGAVYYLKKFMKNHSITAELELNDESRVLVINTEGDTDEENYRKIVWDGFLPVQ